MPRKKLPKSIEEEAVRLRLQGYARDEIAETLGVSAGTVSKILASFQNTAEREGLKAAAAQYDVEPQVSELIALSSLLRKHGLTVGQAVAGARIMAKLTAMGIEEKDFEAYTSRLYQEIIKTSVNPRELVQAAQHLLQLEKQVGKTYPTILQEYEQLSKEANGLKQEIQNLKYEYAKLLEEKKVKIQQVEEYIKIREQLASYGFNIQDLEKTASILQNLKENNYDASKIIALLTKIDSLKGEEQQLNSKLEEQRRRLQELEDRLSQINSELKKNENLLNELNELKQLKLDIQKLSTLINKIKRIAASHNIDPERAVSKLFEDIENKYDEMLGFEKRISSLKEEVRKLDSEIQEYQEKVDKVKTEYAQLTEALRTIQALRKQGVQPSDIVAWEKILAKAKIRPDELTRYLEEFSNIQSLIEEKSRELKDIEIKIKEDEMKLSELERQKEAMESVIKDTLGKLHEKLEDITRSYTQNIEKSSKEAIDKIIQSTETTRKKLLETGSELRKSIEDTSVRIQEVRKEVDSLVEKSIEVGEAIGRLEALKPLLEFIETGQGPPNEVIPNMINILERFRAWLKHSGLSSLSYTTETSLDSLISDLKEAITSGLQ